MLLELNKHRVKVQYDKSVRSRRFSEGDLFLLWDQAKETLGVGKFNPMWHGPSLRGQMCVIEGRL